MYQIKKVTELDLDHVEILMNAFFEDPFYSYVFPDIEKRKKQMQWWMETMIKNCLRYGQMFSLGPGFLLIFGPDRPWYSTFNLIRCGLWKSIFMMSVREIMRLLEISNVWEKWHHSIKDHHFYIFVIGVKPDEQGNGYGKGLMQWIIDKAKNEQLFCYLETMTNENVSFYKNLGFDIFKQGHTKDNRNYWSMRT